MSSTTALVVGTNDFTAQLTTYLLRLDGPAQHEKCSVAGELKETEQRLLTTHAYIHAYVYILAY